MFKFRDMGPVCTWVWRVEPTNVYQSKYVETDITFETWEAAMEWWEQEGRPNVVIAWDGRNSNKV